MARPDGKKKTVEWDEFECPECTANNPYGQGFTWGDDIFCSYCGQSFHVKKVEEDLEGRPRYQLVLI